MDTEYLPIVYLLLVIMVHALSGSVGRVRVEPVALRSRVRMKAAP